jgi:hypothetical protein
MASYIECEDCSFDGVKAYLVEALGKLDLDGVRIKKEDIVYVVPTYDVEDFYSDRDVILSNRKNQLIVEKYLRYNRMKVSDYNKIVKGEKELPEGCPDLPKEGTIK